MAVRVVSGSAARVRRTLTALRLFPSPVPAVGQCAPSSTGAAHALPAGSSTARSLRGFGSTAVASAAGAAAVHQHRRWRGSDGGGAWWAAATAAAAAGWWASSAAAAVTCEEEVAKSVAVKSEGPVYTRAEVAAHSSPQTGVWVTFNDGV